MDVGSRFVQEVQQAAGARPLADLEGLRFPLRASGGHQEIDVGLIEVLPRRQERGTQALVGDVGADRFDGVDCGTGEVQRGREVAAILLGSRQRQCDLSL